MNWLVYREVETIPIIQGVKGQEAKGSEPALGCRSRTLCHQNSSFPVNEESFALRMDLCADLIKIAARVSKLSPGR